LHVAQHLRTTYVYLDKVATAVSIKSLFESGRIVLWKERSSVTSYTRSIPMAPL
jgi:hypothetical protein